jgi:Rod binding domain-containing protein
MITSPAFATMQPKDAGSSISSAKLGQLREQAKEFEGIFLNTLLKEMFASLKTGDSGMGSGFAEETWRGMQAEHMADSVAQTGGIGLADAILPDLIAAQEAAQNATNSRGAI